MSTLSLHPSSPLDAQPHILVEDLDAIVCETSAAFLGWDLTPQLTESGTQPYDDGTHLVSAAITISGGIDSVIVITMTQRDAETTARAMLQLDDVAPEDVIDTVGELVNIVAGGLKSLLDAPCSLGLPVAARASLGATRVSDFSLLRSYTGAGVCVRVEVHEYTKAATAGDRR